MADVPDTGMGSQSVPDSQSGTGTGRTGRQPRPGFRKRINPYYGGMTRRQIAEDTVKTTARWAMTTVFFFVYWMAVLLLLSLFLLNVWHVKFTTLVIYAVILTAVSSAVYAAVLVHRKFYY